MDDKYIEKKSLLSNKKTNMLIKIESSLIGTPLIGLYKKTDDDYLVAVLPDIKKEPKQLSIAEVCSQVANIPGVSVDKANIETLVKSILPEKLEISLKINELYYMKEKKGKDETTDYAFELTLLTKNFSVIGINIESASLAIWNTEKKSELERMGIAEILSLLQ